MGGWISWYADGDASTCLAECSRSAAALTWAWADRQSSAARERWRCLAVPAVPEIVLSSRSMKK